MDHTEETILLTVSLIEPYLRVKPEFIPTLFSYEFTEFRHN